MKFLALRDQLEKVERKQSKINEPKPNTPASTNNYRPPRERVEGGIILWKPIDKAAAMLLAKAPWWAAPPPTTPQLIEQAKPKPRKRKKRMKSGFAVDEPGFAQPDGPHIGRVHGDVKTKIVNGEELICWADMAVKIIEEINKMPQELTPLARAAIDARKVLDEQMVGIGGRMDEFRASSKTALEEIRQTRFAFVAETSQMAGQLKEIRQFFIGPNHETEIARLREFVDLCERLQKLKAAGFLDAVADTMIRLA